jgi:hypothetical protein
MLKLCYYALQLTEFGIFMQNKKRFSKIISNCDLGTPELIYKRAFYATKEPLDLCFEKGLITILQHQYGTRLRWLYTIRHGAPAISSNYPQEFLNSENYRNPEWIAKQQYAYRCIMKEVKKEGYMKIISDSCIYNIYPIFLLNPKSKMAQREFETFKYAMASLERILEETMKTH